MKPGLVVKLRPSGPWRIGPDSGARNRVDVIYHSDSLYSAVTSAMSRLGKLDAWLDATARNQAPAVCFSSCFPFVEDTGFVIPPRTLWPPASQSRTAGRVRWKTARFIPLGMVQTILAGEPLDDNRWSIDGPSGCLMPAGTPGPFRTSVRWGAAVDRLSGMSERHSTACMEFRPGAGLWTVVGFADDGARDEWQDAVKAAFRLLADTGFGGERSRGWGRSETPEFIEGELPGLIIGESPQPAAATSVAATEPPDSYGGQGTSGESNEMDGLVPTEEPASDQSRDREGAPSATEVAGADEPPEPHGGQGTSGESNEMEGLVPTEGPASDQSEPAPDQSRDREGAVTVIETSGADETPANPASEPEPETAGAQQTAPPDIAPLRVEPDPEAPPDEPSPVPPIEEPPIEQPPAEEPPPAEPPPPTDPEPPPAPRTAALPNGRVATRSHWLLSLFTPAAADTVDWARGNYTVLARGGRVDSPAGSGGLKKQIQMVAEGSVLIAEDAPRGAAADVAPDGFAHPVFRAGFALAITLPEAN